MGRNSLYSWMQKSYLGQKGYEAKARVIIALGRAPRTCQYIKAEKQRYTDADKCGAPTIPDSPYCARHATLCGRSSEDNANDGTSEAPAAAVL